MAKKPSKMRPIDDIDDRHPLPEDRPDFPSHDTDTGGGTGGGGSTPPVEKTWWQKNKITVIGLGLIFGLLAVILLAALL